MHKLLIALITAILALPVYACPNLTGHFSCALEDGTIEALVISQKTQASVTIFTLNDSEMPADNVAYSIQGDPTFRGASIRAWCENEVFKSELLGEFFRGEESTGQMNTVTSFSLVDDKLIEAGCGKMVNASGEYPIHSQVICTRITPPEVP